MVEGADLVISYDFDDLAVAERWRSALEGAGVSCWMARKHRGSITVGSDLKEAIGTAIEQAVGVLVLVSTSSMRSKWVRWEADLAWEEEKEVFQVLTESIELPREWTKRYGQALIEGPPESDEDFESVVGEISKRIQACGPGTGRAPTTAAVPPVVRPPIQRSGRVEAILGDGPGFVDVVGRSIRYATAGESASTDVDFVPTSVVADVDGRYVVAVGSDRVALLAAKRRRLDLVSTEDLPGGGQALCALVREDFVHVLLGGDETEEIRLSRLGPGLTRRNAPPALDAVIVAGGDVRVGTHGALRASGRLADVFADLPAGGWWSVDAARHEGRMCVAGVQVTDSVARLRVLVGVADRWGPTVTIDLPDAGRAMVGRGRAAPLVGIATDEALLAWTLPTEAG